MEHGSIERELHINASPDIVFEVLSNPEHIREWWSADAVFSPEPGKTGNLTWRNEDTGGQQSAPFTVVEVDPPHRFSFRWTYDEQIGRQGNSLLVSFVLHPAASGTRVLFSETGFRERGWEASVLEAHYHDHRQGWDFYLPRLAAVADRLALAP